MSAYTAFAVTLVVVASGGTLAIVGLFRLFAPRRGQLDQQQPGDKQSERLRRVLPTGMVDHHGSLSATNRE